MSELARLEVEQRGDECLVRIRGEVDISNARELSAAVQAAIPNGTLRIALDLTETTYLDSAGVQVLFHLADRLKVRRNELRVVVPDGSPIREVLELTGLPKLVPLHAPPDERAESVPNGFPAKGMELTHLLVVDDLDRSVRFYRDVLGAELVRQYGGTSAVFRLLGDWLLVVTGGGPTDDKPNVTFAPPGDANVVSTEMIFRVPDCHAAYDELAARGATFLTPPVDHGGEVRAFFRDPDGHLFEISEVTR